MGVESHPAVDQRVRSEIVTEMDRQGIAVDLERLDDTALLDAPGDETLHLWCGSESYGGGTDQTQLVAAFLYGGCAFEFLKITIYVGVIP